MKKKYHKLIVETWACHEALRRLGFRSDDIYVIADANGDVGVQLQAQEKTFNVRVGRRGMSVDAFHRQWLAFIETVKSIPEPELMKMWEASNVRRNAVPLVMSLSLKGFRLEHGQSMLN